VQEIYAAGKFERFGLSNFTPAQVEEIHAYCQEHGYVLPTVYQGNYNPVSRRIEQELFPVLRRLGLSFYVYSAIAAGFLAKTPVQITEGSLSGRWDPNTAQGSRMHARYNKPKLLEGLAEWNAISQEVGVSGAELAYRFMTYHSHAKPEHGDAIIVGASRPEQLEQTLKGIENGPLPQNIVDRIDGVWRIVESEAPAIGLDRD